MKAMKTIYFIVVLFLFLFSFKLPLIQNSIFLAFILSIPFLTGKSLFYFSSFVKFRLFLASFWGLSIVIFYYVILTILLGNYDYSLVRIYAGVIVYGIIGVFISSIIYTSIENVKLSDLIFFCLAIQAVIITISFISPSFKLIMDFFRSDESIDVASRYFGGGVRGLALSGSQFFGLAALLASMIYYSCIVEFQEKRRVFFYLAILIFSVIFLSVGRTVIFGFCFFLLFLIINMKKSPYVLIKIFLCVALIALLGIYLTPFINQTLSGKIDEFILFAFEVVINYISTGEVSTSSTDVLYNMYYPLSIDTIILGDGQYMNADSTFYGYTDAGYMRNTLAFGLPLTAILITSFMVFVSIAKGSLHNNFKLSGIFLFLMMLCVLHYKGEVFWTLLSVVGFISFISSYSYFISRAH